MYFMENVDFMENVKLARNVKQFRETFVDHQWDNFLRPLVFASLFGICISSAFVMSFKINLQKRAIN